MIKYRFRKASPPEQRHDRSFYDRFNLAWTNLQENEVELRVRLLTAESKPGKSPRFKNSEVRM